MSAIQQVLAAYGEVAPAAYWNAADKNANAVLSSDTKSMWRGGSGSAHALVRAVTGHSTGKRYVEFYSPQARGNVPGGGPIGGLVTPAYSLSSGPGDAAGGIAVAFRRYLSAGDSAFFYRNGSAINMAFNVAAATGWMGLAVNFGTGSVYIVIDGTWVDGRLPNGGAGFYSTVPTSGTLYPAASTYYPLSTYPDASVTLRVLASEMGVGASAFNTGGVLDGFSPWGA